MAQKFAIFISNLNYIIESNARINSPSSHILGLNKFSDWSPEEFKETYLNLEIPTDNDIELNDLPYIALHSPIDLRVKGVVSAIKNQWSFVQPIPNFFSVHGLWPSTRHKDQPRDCNSTYTFPPNEKDIKNKWNPDLFNNINQYWISLQKTKYKLWSGEWKHHGTCAKKDANISLNVEEYFSKTVDAYFKYKVQDVLNPLSQQKVPIIPGKEYSFDTLIAAFKAAFNNTDVSLKCTMIEDPTTKLLKEQHLREVLIYMDNDLNKIEVEEEYKITECDKNKEVIFTGK
ncbi:hypothetical protein TanjilG_01172 [Lupinus angustifolius]|uniref:Cathepsin propeptide inhibitor domain-containing protein n=1 Tax=Lupinus angustifolius TaxID=3871 RepID=A0A1J7GWM4_LUPAN|nr:hypothetical protein TanjilG_01172 [Lupinus angustifolius]